MASYFLPCTSVACPLVVPDFSPGTVECAQVMAACDACSRAYYCETPDQGLCPIPAGAQNYRNYCHHLIADPDYQCVMGDNPWRQTVVCSSATWATVYEFAML